MTTFTVVVQLTPRDEPLVFCECSSRSYAEHVRDFLLRAQPEGATVTITSDADSDPAPDIDATAF